MNLLGGPNYPPTISLVSNVLVGTQYLATNFTTYVDDSIVATGSVEEECRVSQIVGFIWKYLYLQDSPHKRRTEGQDRDPWRGTKVHIIDGSIYHMIGEAKWANSRLIIKNVSYNRIGRTPGLQGVTK